VCSVRSSWLLASLQSEPGAAEQLYKTAHFKMEENLVAGNSMHKLSLLTRLHSTTWEQFAFGRVRFELTYRKLGALHIDRSRSTK
jgi:hypothetical protein